MLRTACRSFLCNDIKLKSLHVQFSSNASSLRQVNQVELIGTIHKHLFTLPSGYKSYIVQTVEPANKFYYHLVGTATTAECPIGQRIHLVGRISSSNYWTVEKALRQKIIIKAGEFTLLPDNDTRDDFNRVRIHSQITSSIENTNNYSSFTMTTRHTPKGGKTSGIFVAEQHRILVRDPSILDLVRYQLKTSYWVSMEGRISYTFSKDSKNKLKQSGYVLAEKLFKGQTIPW